MDKDYSISTDFRCVASGNGGILMGTEKGILLTFGFVFSLAITNSLGLVEVKIYYFKIFYER
jgi:hypothetical protein